MKDIIELPRLHSPYPNERIFTKLLDFLQQFRAHLEKNGIVEEMKTVKKKKNGAPRLVRTNELPFRLSETAVAFLSTG